MSNGLAHRLRTETRERHMSAERSGIMPHFLRGQIGRPMYASMLRNLFVVYDALEHALRRHAKSPFVAPFGFPAMFRLAALDRDLRTLAGSGWSDLPVMPAAASLAARIREAGGQDPQLVAAHAYVRYLGDLSGGQALGKVVARIFGFPPGEGTDFYQFSEIDDVDAFKHRFRASLDLLPVTDGGDAMVAEAVESFRWHERLFVELMPTPA